MNGIFHHLRPLSAFFLGLFLAAQVVTVAGVLAIPAPARATAPIVVVGNVYDVLKDIAIGVAKGFAQAFINQYLQKFINKVVEKYKIRNYLYYDQVLTNYLLTNYIGDKIADPDLRRIYSLLNAAYVTGQPTGATGYNPQNALIPQLKRAINSYYLKSGGVNPDTIKNPPVAMSDYEYFQSAQRYYMNPPGYTAMQLQGQYGSFQSSATTAAQLEVIVGNGLKAGRFVGGTCQFIGPLQAGQTLPTTPDGCRAIGGTWQASALDQARSFIDNPASFVNSWLDKGIMKIMDGNYDPNNIWTQIGSALGSFIYNRLFLDRQGGVLVDDPRPYVPDPGTPNNGTPVDIDGDGVTDGYDTNNDGQPDICVFGGANGPVGPPCKGSRAATTDPGSGGTGTCAGLPLSRDFQGDLQSAEDAVNAANPNGVADALNTESDARAYLNEVAAVLQSRGFLASTDVLNGNNNPNHGDLIAIWRPGDILAERYDAVISVGSGDRPMRDAATAQYVNDVPIADCIP